MRRPYFLTIALAALCVAPFLFSSCHKDDKGELSEVNIKVNDFNIVNGEVGGTVAKDGVSADTYTNVKYLTVAFYDANGVAQYQSTHSRLDVTTFEGLSMGNFHCMLPAGTYTMVVIGHGSDSALTIASKTLATFSRDRVRDCFVKSQSVTISSSGVNNITATLDRIVSVFILKSTDIQPTGVDSIHVAVNKGSRSFDPTTGLASDDNGVAYTLNASGATGSTLTAPIYLLLSSDTEVIDVTFTIYQNGSVLSTRTLSNVEMKRNRQTIATGEVYYNSGTGFSFNTTWLTSHNVTF